MPTHLAIVETHPIQYKAPWFRRLAIEPGIEVEVFYAMEPDASQQGAGFGVPFEWDQPLREGYPSRVLCNVARHPSLTRFDGCDTPELYGVVRHGRWDAVLVNGWGTKTCVQALAAARLAGVPCIVRGEANALRPRASWKRMAHRALLRQYAAFLYIGRANRAFYRSHGIGEERLFFGPYCVDNERFARIAAEEAPRRGALRARWGIAPDACCFLFAGKLEPKKRPLDLVEAAARPRPGTAGTPPAMHLLFGGDGILREACEDACRQRGVPATFTGFLNQSEMPAAYTAADALVLPSDAGETWGLVVNEAMACGLPAVVSDRVGCQEDLVDASTGWVYRCGDVTALADALREAERDPDARAAKGAAARARVASYSVEALAQGTVDAVRFAVDHGGGRPRRARRMPA